ncbi:TetR family transcriptional regulator [Lentzea sp. NBRC 105346]|uniref:TetR/AcrR family transcriptional regulator n=1 Tax=Lentzea sp. NBRC 105346 TaxID=3032205 RepID=UPI0024A0CA4A|nr:TetR/AcrR family transcriptional regulator [Lentzea sp. NBRC 105346]GLZ28473.1 TetR family transcriptional regulator [Lentzea sp. NBRC 105346]
MEDSRSARKRRAIVEAARQVFLRSGYAGASMDEVASLASVSKQTVYKHFADKERLFTGIVLGDIEQTRARAREAVEALPDNGDVAAHLREIARLMITTLMAPHLVRQRRMIIGAADRFPEVARAWRESSPERVFAARFEALAGLLEITDACLAAQHLTSLVLSSPMNRAMFTPGDEPFPKAELERFADEAVRVFLAAYGPKREGNP